MFQKYIVNQFPDRKNSIRRRSELAIGTVVKTPNTVIGTVVKTPKPSVGTVVKPPESLIGTVVKPPKTPIGTDLRQPRSPLNLFQSSWFVLAWLLLAFNHQGETGGFGPFGSMQHAQALSRVENLDPDCSSAGVEIEQDARSDLLGFGGFRALGREPDEERIGFQVAARADQHRAPRSKWALITR
jgi:hypothetical protein